MTLNHGGLLTSCFVILLAIATSGSANAAPAARSSVIQHRHHGVQIPHRHLYNYYPGYYPGPGVARPGCYLPSDGCDSEYSVQN
jgi:hypothetical protein